MKTLTAAVLFALSASALAAPAAERRISVDAADAGALSLPATIGWIFG